jgi:hypothetical protein
VTGWIRSRLRSVPHMVRDLAQARLGRADPRAA